MSASDLEELSATSLKAVIELIHKFTGITMNPGKKTLIQGRLRPRIAQLGLQSYDQYIAYLNSNKNESQEFINLVTTNETSFFRTKRVWDYFSKDFLPEWTAKNPKKTLKVWSAASSSGEEVYTIGICCEEHRRKNDGFSFQIFGTDISSDVLEMAEKGEYFGRSIEAFKTSDRSLFDGYMQPVGESFRVISEVKNKIRFSTHNLFNPPKERNFDIIFLRNVLIYFESKDQEKVLANIGQGLAADGILIIGESESLSSLSTPFKYLRPLVYGKSGEKN